MDYCAVPVPSKITDALGTKGPVLVLARVNESTPFQVSLFPVGCGQHSIRIKAKVRKEVGIKVGDRIQVWIIVLDRAQVEIPQDLKVQLQAAKLEQAFESLPPGKKNFIVRRISEASKLQTREKRIQEALEAARSAA